MKRILLSLCVAMLSVSPLLASVSAGPGKPAYEQTLTDISFDSKTNQLSFTDAYKPNAYVNRQYIVEYFYRTDATDIIRVALGGEVVYTYGAWNSANYMPTFVVDPETGVRIDQTFTMPHSMGGTRYLNLSEGISACMHAGEGRLFIAIRGVDMETGKPFEAIQSNFKNEMGCHLNNNISVTLTNFVKFGFEAIEEVYYGEEDDFILTIQGVDEVYYWIQAESDSGEYWSTFESGMLSQLEAREGVRKHFYRPFNADFYPATQRYRAVIEDNLTGVRDTSEIVTVRYFYKWTDDKQTRYFQPGREIEYLLPGECKEYVVAQSNRYVGRKEKDGKVYFYQPRSNVVVKVAPKHYTVKFYNADYTLLKTDTVECGSAATAPNNPTYQTLTFAGWSKSFDNVQSNMSVIARYKVNEGEYNIFPTQEGHINSRYPYGHFAESTTRIMAGDSLIFTVGVFATFSAPLYRELGYWNTTDEKWIWGEETKICDYTENTTGLLTDTVDACYDRWNVRVKALEHRFAVRYYLLSVGNKLCSEPMEYDIYYPTAIRSLRGQQLFVENNMGDFEQNVTTTIPARCGDTVVVKNMSGSGGGCFSYKRVIKPLSTVQSGLNGDGESYFLAPGEIDTLEVSTSQYAVVFDGASPIQVFDFTAQGLGKYNAYYAEVADCGGSIEHLPDDPVSEGYIFKGWEPWNNEYDSLAYMNVPAVGGLSIGFSAKWKEINPVPTYTVRFYGKDSSLQLGSDQIVEEGSDAVPPEVPEITGWHFIGWDKPYKKIKADVDIIALYADDTKTWVVTYYDMDGTTKLSEETVLDGVAALKNLFVSHKNYNFEYWEDMATHQPADLNHITSDMSVKAIFTLVANPLYEVTLVAEHGTITVNETDVDLLAVPVNTVLHLTAVADDGYIFKQWSDKTTNSHLTVTVTEDMTIIAEFEKKSSEGGEGGDDPGDQAIDEVGSDNNDTISKKILRNGQLFILHNGQIYNAQGQLVDK